MERLEGVGTTGDETVVKVDKTEELSQLALGGGLREIADDAYLLLKRADALAVHMMPKELQMCHSQHALGWIDQDAILAQSLQDQPEVLLVLVGVRTGDEDVVHVSIAELEAAKDLIHKALEGLSCVTQSERHP